MKNLQAFILTAVVLCASCSKDACGPIPSPAQLEWQQMEYNMFVHFGPNTFSGLEWGQGTEPEDLFNPTGLDCRQWAATAKAAGMKGIIITAKHHDGFCLWPSKTTTHTVAQSSWRDGKGDVLAELSEACREYGLKFGVYVSPWDRNHPAYGTPEYNNVYVQALEGVHSNYGPLFEHWFDGACGEGPAGKKQVYDWDAFYATVRRLSPEAVMFSDIGPGCRWVGNERGEAGETNWSTLDTEGFTPGAGAPPTDTLQQGNVFGSQWVPAEIDVSIRPGWFWRESENDKVKSVEALMKIWIESVGRNSLLLLNVPPDTSGRICKVDSLRLMEFRDAREAVFGTDLAAGAKIRKRHGGTVWEITLPEYRSFDYVQLREDIRFGQKISSFRVDIQDFDIAIAYGGWLPIAEGTTIGYKRIIPTMHCKTKRLRVVITGSHDRPKLESISLFSQE